jgi:squalene-hopene/tetraprenyl-beta-curcumene cyclase
MRITLGAFTVAACLAGRAAGGQEAEFPSPGRNSPEEPVAREASPAKAAAFLDSAAIQWTRRRQCGTCHTNFPYLWARPALKAFESPASGEVRAFFERLADAWEPDKPPRKFKVDGAWEAQIVGTAVSLAVNDARTTGTLHPLTRKALDRVWTLQREDGSWKWPQCDWPPLEHDDYFGATYVAIGVGSAPDGYAATEAAKAGLEKLRGYFRAHPAPDLHHRLMLLWASARLEGLMAPAERDAVTREVLARQKEDGGWCLPSFGRWKRHDDTANREDAPADGYATGLAVYVLRTAGFPSDHAAVRRGVSWLKANQRASGRWFTRSLSSDDHHYVTHVGTAYAVLALDACGELR